MNKAVFGNFAALRQYIGIHPDATPVEHQIESELLQPTPRSIYRTSHLPTRTRWETVVTMLGYALFAVLFVIVPIVLMAEGVREIAEAVIRSNGTGVIEGLVFIVFGVAFALSGLLRTSCDTLERLCVERGKPLIATVYRKASGSSDRGDILFYRFRSRTGQMVHSEKYVTDTEYGCVNVGDTLTILHLPKVHPFFFNVIYRFTSYAAVPPNS